MATSGDGPVRHTVMAKLHNKEDKYKVAESLMAMANGLSGVTWTSFNVVTDLGLVETNADVSFIIDFPDKENYLAFAKHPQQLSIVHNNAPMVANRLMLQFTPPAPKV